MENNITHYYFESDFKLIDTNVQAGVPFAFLYYVKQGGETLSASYDGLNYTNCHPSDEVEGAIVVPFNNFGGKYGIGRLKVKRVYSIEDMDMANAQFNSVTEEVLPIELWRGPSDDVAGDAVIVYDSLYRGPKGDKGDDGAPLTYDDLTENEKNDLASRGPRVEIVNDLETGGEDKALSAEMGKGLAESVGFLADELEALKNSGGGGGSTSNGVSLSGMLNLTDIQAVKNAQSGLGENDARFYVIADSSGKLPSKEKCYDVPENVVRRLSMTTGNSIVDGLLGSVSVDPIGVSVGDLIAITKVPVAIADIAENFGLSIPLPGTVSIYQYKILHTNEARPVSDVCVNGVSGLMTPADKKRVDKVDGVEWTANDTRNWLASVNNTIENNLPRTRYPYGTDIDSCLTTGVCAYTNSVVNGIQANWTFFVECSADVDSGGYYHLIQTAICRDSAYEGKMYRRLGWYKKNGASIDGLNFMAWQDGSGDSGSGNEYVDVFHCIVDVSTDEIIDYTTEILKTPIVGISAIQKGDEVVDYVLSLRDLEGNVLYVMGTDYTYIFGNDGGTWVLAEKNPTYSARFATKEDLSKYAKISDVPTKTSQLTNDSGYVSVIPNLLKNTNFGDDLNGWTKSGSVTIKNDVYEGIGAAYIDGGGMLGQDVTLDAGVYTLSFRVANSSISRDYPLKVLLRRASVSNVVTNAYGWNNDDIPTIVVTSVSDKVYITFTLALASNINIDFENSRYGCLVDSIRLEKGDTASAYDEYLIQKRLVSGLNISTVNGQSLLGGGNITISGGVTEERVVEMIAQSITNTLNTEV